MNAQQMDMRIAAQIAAAPEGEPVVIGCARVESRAHVPSVARNCQTCDARVWVSKRVIAAAPARARFVCVECLML